MDRARGERGFCRTADRALVASYGPHFGEEDPLVGSGGSGTIFFTFCNLCCSFCQNHDISHQAAGREAGPGELAGIMIDLARRGVGNINFVTPSHVVAQILEALPLAIEAGLRLPLVYNAGGYESVETLKLLEDVFDIYMPDLKFLDPAAAGRFCQAPDYPEQARRAVLEMHRQVGNLVMDDQGRAERGLLVRHLVMPGMLEDTRQICRFLARSVSPRTYVNVMGQYRPLGRAAEHPEIDRPLTGEELATARQIARREGLTRLDERRGPRFPGI